MNEQRVSGRRATVQGLVEAKVIGILRVDEEATALRIGEALLDAGFQAVEVTFTVPGAERVIEALAGRRPDALIGAGTIRDEGAVQRAVRAGAKYVVSPGFVPGVVREAHRHGVPALPGVMTPSETMGALDAGADILKLFPATSLGPSYLQALRGPFPEAMWCPTGGVSLENADGWLDAGADLVGVGGPLIGDVAVTGDYDALVVRAQGWVNWARAQNRGG